MTDDPAASLFNGLLIGGLLLFTTGRRFLRRRAGRYFDTRRGEHVLYRDRSASGSGARNCLSVVVTPDTIYITPVFPFWVFAPLDFDHRIRKRDIISRRETRGPLGKRTLHLTYHDERGIVRHLTLTTHRDRFPRLNWAVSTGSPQEG